jgi:Na+/melibiose symporter-like transporter
MRLNSLIKKYFFSDAILTKKDYEKSRKYFLYEGCTAVGIFSLTSGAFLAGFAKYLGATDEFNGLIGAIPAVAGIVQIFSSLIFEKMEHRKLLISFLCVVYRLLLGFMLLIPIFIHGTSGRLFALALTYSLAYGFAAFITPAASSWIVDLTPENRRGNYFALKDAYSLAFVTVITLIMGKVLDIYRKANNEYGGFIVLGFVVMILACANFSFLSVVKEPTQNRKKSNINLKTVLTMALNNKGFRKVIILSVLWNIALQIGGPFFAVYQVTGLKLSYSYIMIMGVISSLVRVFIAKTWGSLADKKSWFFTTKSSAAILGIVHIIWTFVDVNTAFILVPLLSIAGGLAWSGLAISMFNIQFVYAPQEGRTAYLGTSAALGGVAGFISTFIGSRVVSYLKGFSFKLFGINIGNMQVVFLLSGILILITALYVQQSMEKGIKKQ